MLLFLLILTHLVPLVTPSLPQKFLSPQPQDQYGPTISNAITNANLIFNSIHSSMRQWGSSVQHNGMSFFPAYVPEGTLLYHGDAQAGRVRGTEWLAFEIQHAEMFAISVRMKALFPRPGKGDGDELSLDEDKVFWDPRNEPPEQLVALDDYPPEIEIKPGYLHIYQANRPLKLLYLDGMSAAKCDLGTMDTQDVLLLNFTLHKFFDRERARELCELGKEWGVEGFIRMEAGFEIIKCDFSAGLDFISHKRRPDFHRPEANNNMFLLDYIREISGRYGGISAGRVKLDYSSMTSAYFYPTNLSNPDQEPGQSVLPRLVESNKRVLERIKSDLRGAIRRSKSSRSVDWQGVADMIVKRYSNRLQFMATDPPRQVLLPQINSMLNLFVEYGNSEPQDPVKTCSLHYLQPVQPTTEQDRLIEIAFKTVTHKICNTIFEVRELILGRQRDGDAKEFETKSSAVGLIRDLMKWLDWSGRKSCGECALDEVCFIAVFPFGTAEDHYNPHCINNTDIKSRIGMTETNYWRPKNRYRSDH